MYLPAQEVLSQNFLFQFFLLFQLLGSYQQLHSILGWAGNQVAVCSLCSIHILSSQSTQHSHQVCFAGRVDVKQLDVQLLPWDGHTRVDLVEQVGEVEVWQLLQS